MKFKLNRETLIANMFNNGKVEHRPGEMIKLLPFIGNATDLKSKEVVKDLKDFKGIAGTCFRACLNLNDKTTFNKEDFIQKICATANAPSNPYLKNIIEQVAFNEQDQLVLFDPSIYPHIRNGNGKENKTLNDIGKCIASLFFDQEEKELLIALANRPLDNLFYKLILVCLPNTTSGLGILERYYQGSEANKTLFRNDLKILLNDPELFISSFHDLLKFYFFKYVSQLAVKLNQFFGERHDQLFFSVKWEALQGYRMPLSNGWQMFESQIEPLFSHVVTLELVNHISGFDKAQVTYREIKNNLTGLSEAEKQNLCDCLEELITMYKDGIQDVDWTQFQPDFSKSQDEQVYRLIIHLFQMVDYQFKKSTRKRVKLAYKDWMKDFTHHNFSQRRGKLGYSLSLDHEQILLLTRLCVGKNEKIRLKELWDGLETRGVFLDNSSRDHVIQYFEKINLLEKKSDSGDAQYVRKFSQTIV